MVEEVNDEIIGDGDIENWYYDNVKNEVFDENLLTEDFVDEDFYLE